MVGISKSKIFLIGSLFVLVLGVVTGYFFYSRSVSTDTADVLGSNVIKSELAKGKCSSETMNLLASASNKGDDAEQAGVYESQALCFVYSNELGSALKSYKLARESFIKAGLSDEAKKLDGPIAGLETITSKPADNSLPDDFEPEGGI